MTLTEYIVSRLIDAGFAVTDLQAILWDTRTDYGDGGPSWINVDIEQFRSIADTLDVSLVTPSARERLRFVVQGQAPDLRLKIFQWDNDVMDFVTQPDRPSIVVLEESDLTA